MGGWDGLFEVDGWSIAFRGRPRGLDALLFVEGVNATGETKTTFSSNTIGSNHT